LDVGADGEDVAGLEVEAEVAVGGRQGVFSGRVSTRDIGAPESRGDVGMLARERVWRSTSRRSSREVMVLVVGRMRR
jgi:hypothetical protein